MQPPSRGSVAASAAAAIVCGAGIAGPLLCLLISEGHVKGSRGAVPAVGVGAPTHGSAL